MCFIRYLGPQIQLRSQTPEDDIEEDTQKIDAVKSGDHTQIIL